MSNNIRSDDHDRQGATDQGTWTQAPTNRGSATRGSATSSPGTRAIESDTARTYLRAFGRSEAPEPSTGAPTQLPDWSTERPARRARIMIIAASVVALLLVAGLATVLVQQKQSADAAASAGPLPSEVVQNYLDAIASGDADTAIGDLAEQPDNTAAMTADVLAASNKTAPITDIEVARTERTARSVRTSYNIGDTTVRTSYQVVPNDSGFRINGGYLIMDVSSLPGGLSYRLNGAELGGDRIALFPGTYTLTTPGDYLSLGKGATFTVKSPTESSTPVVEPAITEAGLKAIREQVSDAVSGCLKSTKLHAGCGLTVGKDGPNGTRAADGTISRTLPGSGRKQLAGLDVWPQPGKPSVARTIGLNTTVDTSAICVREKKVKKKGNKPKTRKIKQDCTLTGTGTSLADVAVDLSKSTPVISWN